VNNESIEILKILNTSFNHLLPESSAGRELDLFPSALTATIDEANSWIYPQINNGQSSAFLLSSPFLKEFIVLDLLSHNKLMRRLSMKSFKPSIDVRRSLLTRGMSSRLSLSLFFLFITSIASFAHRIRSPRWIFASL
jgi:hypothetical protein